MERQEAKKGGADQEEVIELEEEVERSDTEEEAERSDTEGKAADDIDFDMIDDRASWELLVGLQRLNVIILQRNIGHV